MNSRHVYRLPGSSYEELEGLIEESRLVLSGRYSTENGEELAHGLYDESGVFISGIETGCNDRVDEIENKEPTDHRTARFRYSAKEFCSMAGTRLIAHLTGLSPFGTIIVTIASGRRLVTTER